MHNQTTEILLILQEECAEVIQAISKCQRFGLNGKKEGENLDNMERLEEEVGDLLAMVELLQTHTQEFKNSWGNIQMAKKSKFEKLKKWSTISFINNS
jgi:NTP pyrophosphatase (non-canonical NTP hydrolase)